MPATLSFCHHGCKIYPPPTADANLRKVFRSITQFSRYSEVITQLIRLLDSSGHSTTSIPIQSQFSPKTSKKRQKHQAPSRGRQITENFNNPRPEHSGSMTPALPPDQFLSFTHEPA